MRFITAIFFLMSTGLIAQPAEMDSAEQLASLGKYYEALNAFNHVIASDPIHVEAYVGRGAVYQHFEWFEKATTDYSMALSLNPNHWEARFARAVLWLPSIDWKNRYRVFSFY
jgi:Flp pilus assembly protein TadD